MLHRLRAALKIVVPVKLVPDTKADKRIDPQTKRLVRSGVATVLNPFDEYALEAALRLRERRRDATVTVVTLAPETGKEVVRKALAMGADDAVMISDARFEGSDVWATAALLAAEIRTLGFDVVLCGVQSTDAGTGELPGALAERLGIPGLTYARAIEVTGTTLRAERETDGGFARVTVSLPALVSVTKAIGEPRSASIRGIMDAKRKPIAIRTAIEPADRLPAARPKTELLAVTPAPARARGRVVPASDGAQGATLVAEFLKERHLL